MPNPPAENEFPHRLWHQLAAADPAGFERARISALEAFVARAPEARQSRLRALQWRLDQSRSREQDAARRCDILATRMWAAVTGPDSLLARLGPQPARRPAKVIPLLDRARHRAAETP